MKRWSVFLADAFKALVVTAALCILSCNINPNVQTGTDDSNVTTLGTSEEEKQSPTQGSSADETASSEEETSSEFVYVPVIFDSVLVEAGTEKLSIEDFFENYNAEKDVVLEGEPTKEELAVAGAKYIVRVICMDLEKDVVVEVTDTTAPVIEAQDFSVEAGETVSYKKQAKVTDNSSNKVKLDVDYSKVKISVPGVYPIKYTATDSSGNVSILKINITVTEKHIVTEEEVFALADTVIGKVTKKNMSKWDIAYKLWNWCRSNIKYTNNSKVDTNSMYSCAYAGMHDKKGDCYVFCYTYSVLLTRAGIDNICVSRVGGLTDHYWNLVNVGDGWYHCDSSPRRNGDPYLCFMQTDEQVFRYTESYPEKPNYYVFDPSLYPERATKIVFGS